MTTSEKVIAVCSLSVAAALMALGGYYQGFHDGAKFTVEEVKKQVNLLLQEQETKPALVQNDKASNRFDEEMK